MKRHYINPLPPNRTLVLVAALIVIAIALIASKIIGQADYNRQLVLQYCEIIAQDIERDRDIEKYVKTHPVDCIAERAKVRANGDLP